MMIPLESSDYYVHKDTCPNNQVRKLDGVEIWYLNHRRQVDLWLHSDIVGGYWLAFVRNIDMRGRLTAAEHAYLYMPGDWKAGKGFAND